jgi:hypothetical protein
MTSGQSERRTAWRLSHQVLLMSDLNSYFARDKNHYYRREILAQFVDALVVARLRGSNASFSSMNTHRKAALTVVSWRCCRSGIILVSKFARKLT